jgi:hypothetical protein
MISSDSEPFLAFDRLRILTSDINRKIKSLQELPSARITHTKSEDLSFYDLETYLEDLKSTKIMPFCDYVIKTGIADKKIAGHYIDSKLDSLRRRCNMHNKLADNAKSAIEEYLVMRGQIRQGDGEGGQGEAGLPGTTVIPQFNNDFIDRIINLASQGETDFQLSLMRGLQEELDAVARLQLEIEYYNAARQAMIDAEANPAEADRQQARTLLQDIIKGLKFVIAQSEELNGMLSGAYLAPQGQIYKIIRPTRKVKVPFVNVTLKIVLIIVINIFAIIVLLGYFVVREYLIKLGWASSK